ncbi:aldehyde dehydrogenase [Sulfidibacter corallicola]
MGQHIQIQNFIDGAMVPPCNGNYMDNIEPATGRVYGQVPDSDAHDIGAAVTAAQRAFPAWSATPVEQRARLLERVADLLESRLEAFAKAESRDQGKPVALAKMVDIPRAVSNFRYFAGAIRHHEESATHMDGKALNYTVRKPVGVAGLISPWNLPLYLLTWKIAPALATGNTCVAKPSEMTSMTAWLLAEVLQEAGIPPGVCNLVFGTGPKAGAALVGHPEVPLISFTGGTETARRIIRDSADGFKKLSLELGGKNAYIVYADADLDQCLPTTLRAAFTNQGEVCLCGSRLFVERPIYERFLERFTPMVEAMVVGDPTQPETNMGALISQAHLKKVRGYIALAREEGGTVHCGGTRPDLPSHLDGGYYLRPTIVTGLTPTCRVMQEEIFGPVVTITPFDSEEEVIAFANGTRYGLSATIWTRDVSRAHRTAHAMDAGIIWVNTWMLRDLRTPFGGMKASGVGREGGAHSIDFYTESQNVCIQF